MTIDDPASILGADDRARVAVSVAAIEAAASGVLARAVDAEQALAFVAVLHDNLDRAVAKVCAPGLAPELQPECRSGCSHCCSTRVELTDPEALVIARHVQALADAERTSLVQALQAQARHHAEPVVAETAPAPRPRRSCAFLRDDRCDIYPLRPATCRKGHSLSAQACASHAPEIPQNLQILIHCESLITGTNRAFRARGLANATHELAAGVLAALAREDALQAWSRGEVLGSCADTPSKGI